MNPQNKPLTFVHRRTACHCLHIKLHRSANASDMTLLFGQQTGDKVRESFAKAISPTGTRFITYRNRAYFEVSLQANINRYLFKYEYLKNIP
jgi:hypothetical protein